MRWHHEAKDLLDYLFYECKSWADVDWRRIDDYVNSTWRGADGGEAGLLETVAGPLAQM